MKKRNPEKRAWNSCSPIGPSERRSCPPTPRPAREGETIPVLSMHADDASRLNLADRDRVSLRLDGGELVLELGIAANMAPGVIVLPRHRQLEWRKLKEWPTFVPDDRIRKIKGAP